MTCNRWAAACVIVLVSRGAARADEAVAPVLFDEAYAVARLDLEKVDLATLYPVLQSVRGWDIPARAELTALVKSLRDAGGKRLYYVWSDDAGVLFVPAGEGASTEKLQAVLRDPLWQRYFVMETSEPLAGGVVAGLRSLIAHLKRDPPQPRPHRAAAAKATADFALQVLVLPTEKNRERAAKAPWAVLPPQSTALAMPRIEWASIGIDGPPRPRLAMRLAATEPEAEGAALLKKSVEMAIDPLLSLSRNVALRDNLREALQWKIQGDMVTLDVDDAEGEVSLLGRGLVQPLFEARAIGEGRRVVINNLKHLGLALHNHHDQLKRFPAPAILDGDGKPLLSWRVAILPFLEDGAGELHKQFHLDEPWDSPHNQTLIARMPAVFASPFYPRSKEGWTVFAASGGEGTVFGGPEGVSIRQIIDGTSNTIAVVEVDADHAVPWTKPDVWQLDPEQPSAGVAIHFDRRFATLFCDGSVHVLERDRQADQLKALFTRAGREPVAP